MTRESGDIFHKVGSVKARKYHGDRINVHVSKGTRYTTLTLRDDKSGMTAYLTPDELVDFVHHLLDIPLPAPLEEE